MVFLKELPQGLPAHEAKHHIGRGAAAQAKLPEIGAVWDLLHLETVA